MIKRFDKALRLKSIDSLHTLGPLVKNGLGCAVDILETVDSTNAYVKECARQGAPEGFVAAAETQTHGRGRFDRAWFSAPGEGLYFSILLRPDMPLGEAPRLTLLAALAVCEALRREADVDAQIKWPNDVLIGGKKCCGILLETGMTADGRYFAVLGIGVNVNMPSFPEEFAATSLFIERGRRFPRALIGRAILREADGLLSELSANGFSGLLERYKARSCTLGQRITVTEGERKNSGVAVGFDELGFLLLRADGGEILRLSSGNVSLRDKPQK